MSLSRHIDPETLIAECKDHPHKQHFADHARQTKQSWSRDCSQNIPKYTIPAEGISAKSAYQLLHDETSLDGNPTLNLASFVHTWMPDEANKLIMENINKNAVDQDEYPATQLIHNRCISMIGDLWHAPKTSKVIGTATSGSSEAIMLAGMALKKRWQEARKKEGKLFHPYKNPGEEGHYPGPNIVFGSNAQVALEKFARYWDVETRLVPVRRDSVENDEDDAFDCSYVLKPEDAIKFIDENTIGVMIILGSTYTGHFEDVSGMSRLLDKLQEERGIDVPIHVDGASGAFFAPFAWPEYTKEWSFDIKRVVSINVSGHKFGLTYAGLGWVLWRDESFLHKDLIFELHYLGSTEYSFTLNFSKPASPIISQMFNFLNLGFNGYRKIALKDLRNARLLSRALERSGYFKVLSNIHKHTKDKSIITKIKNLSMNEEEDSASAPEMYQRGLPVVAFHLSAEYKKKYPMVQQVWIQTMLRTKGWIVPNYAAPKGAEDVEVLRVVVRESLTEDLTERLIVDILETAETLMESTGAIGMLDHKQGLHQPDKEHGRPDEKNFGGGIDEVGPGGQIKDGKEQVGFARQC